jgi:hypothetical protein
MKGRKVAWGRIIFSVLCLCAAYLWWFFSHYAHAHAMEYQEVKPYAFAELPHGTIYKTVHEGCELYIVETNNDRADSMGKGFTYSITAGRGCK